MKRIKTFNTVLGLALVAMIATVSAGHAQYTTGGCDYPLFVASGVSDANIIILFDDSGSMNEAIYHPNFDPNATYSGGFCGDCMYYAGGGTYTINGRTADLTSSDGGQSGRYIGNYLNWIFWHASSAERASLPQVTRVQVAKVAVKQIIDENPAFRFGLSVFADDVTYNGTGNTGIYAPLGTNHATLKTDVDNIVAITSTPIAPTMLEVYDHWKNSSAIAFECEKMFFIIVSDGYPTNDYVSSSDFTSRGMPSDGDVDGDNNEPGNCSSIGAPYSNSDNCSDYMDDIAAYMYLNDMRSDLDGVQNVLTYTIGFGIDAPLFQQTADNAGGLYLNATSPAELTTALQQVLNNINDQVSSGSAVAVVSTEGSSDNYLYQGKFETGGWKGHLEAYALPYIYGDLPVWDAGDILESAGANSRTIFTSLSGTKVNFVDGNASALQASIGAATQAEAEDLINWTRGDAVSGYRNRDGWILGDIVESAPVVVGAPAYFYLFNSYLAWRSANQNRQPIILVGANDGMLHAFNEETGVELWAYLPEAMLPRLDDLAAVGYCHEYSVNLTPYVFDAYVSGSWRTIAVCGQKQGGNTYFALDVTDPYNPVVMWESQLPMTYNSWNQPSLVRLKDGDRFAMLVGSGPDYTGLEAHVMLVDLSDGTMIASDLISTGSSIDVNMTTRITVLDKDYDGYDDYAYLGTLEGDIWRYDLSPTSITSGTSLTAPKFQLFDGDDPIQAQPILGIDYNGDVYVFFGTGRYLDRDDITENADQYFVALIDDGSNTTLDLGDLHDQTSSITTLNDTDRGWYFDLELGDGERVTEPGALVAGVVYFTSYDPTDDLCSAGGYSWLYSVDSRDGSAEDGDDETDDGTSGRAEGLGDGIATRPVIDIVNGTAITVTSDAKKHVDDIKRLHQPLQVRHWRQVYD